VGIDKKGFLYKVRRRGKGERESLCGEDMDANELGRGGVAVAVLLFWRKKKKMAPKNLFSFLARG
jgi:hypothetical protein